MASEFTIVGEKWGREEGGKFMPREKLFDMLKVGGKHSHADCDIRTGMAEVNMAKYVMHAGGGCKYLLKYLHIKVNVPTLTYSFSVK